MNLIKNVPTASKQIVVGEKLIEAGNDVWQIKNLTGISNKESKVSIDIPEPYFAEKEPEGKLTIFNAIFIFGLFFIAAAYFNVAFLFWVGVAAGVANIWDSNSDQKRAWENRKKAHEKQHAVWMELKNNPPTVYSLAIETNSGSRPIFYSFDKIGISRAVVAIKEAMKSPVKDQVVLNINAIEGDMNINQMGATIYRQNLQEVNV